MDHWLKRTFSSPIINFFGRLKADRHFSNPPILIGGCGRSGTTLLLSILSAHPEIFAIPNETDAFTQWKYAATGLIPVRIDRFYRSLLLNRINSANNRWCEKRPANVQHIPEILSYFGEKARFIHLVRDPRAVCTSRHPSSPDEYWIPIDRYISDVNAGLAYNNHPQVLTIKYEDLIIDFSTTLNVITEFLAIDLTEELLDWHEHATVRLHKAWDGEVSGLDQSSLFKWKKPIHVNRVNAILSDERMQTIMKRLNYQ